MCSRLGKKRASFGEPWFMSRRESSIGIRPSWVPCCVKFSYMDYLLVVYFGGEGGNGLRL